MRLPCILATLVSACATPTAHRVVDHHAVAELLVDRVANVRAGEKVLILGEPRFVELMEEIWLVARARGASPMVQLGGPDLFERYFAEVPAERDHDPPSWELALAEIVDVLIKLQPHHPETLREAPVDRATALNAALEPAEERKLQRKVRQVLVGNGLLPTDGMAEHHGIAPEQLEEIFWSSITVDPETLRSRGQGVKAAIDGGRELRVSHDNGTDLSMEITGRPTFLAAGTISSKDTEAGASGMLFLPSGEVWCTPVPGTTHGRLVIDLAKTAAGDVEGLTLTVAAGAVTEVTAAPSAAFDAWRSQYDAAPAGKEQLSWIAIGLNPAVRPPEGHRLLNFVGTGIVTLGVGKNTWAGGDNAVPYGVYLFLPDATLAVDDEVLLRHGELL